MNLSDFLAVVRKETREASQDLQTLLLVMIMCAGYPAVVCTLCIARDKGELPAQTLNVGVLGDFQTAQKLMQDKSIHLQNIPNIQVAQKKLEDKKVSAIVTVPPGISENKLEADLSPKSKDSKTGASDQPAKPAVPEVTIESASDPYSIESEARLTTVLEQARRELLRNKMERLNLNSAWFTSTEAVPITLRKQQFSAYLATSLPFMLTVIIVAIAASFAMESINGERARKTWTLLLASAADRNSLLYGKLLVNISLVIIGIATCLGSLMMFSAIAGAQAAHAGIAFQLRDTIVALAVALPLAISLPAFFFLLCMYAKSTQEAGIFIAAATIISVLLAAVALVPAKFVAPALYCLPIVSVSLCLSESVGLKIDVLHVAESFIASCLFGAACVYGCASALQDESLLFNVDTVKEFRRNYIRVVAALGVLEFLLFFYIGQMLMSINVFWGTLAAQTLVLATPALIVVHKCKLPVAATMRFKRVHWSVLLGGALIAPGVTALTFLAAAMQNTILPAPEQFEKMLKELILTGHPLWQTFLAIAITPGICEELLFRGAVLGMLTKTMKPLPACIMTGVLFGLFHMSSFRFVPTCIAGIALSIITVTTGSIFPAMILHAVHNSLAIYIAMHEDMLAWWQLAPALASAITGAFLVGWLRLPRRNEP